MINVSIEKWEEVEAQREEVMGSTEFQNWVKELNVSRSWEDPQPKLRATEMMRDWEWKRLGLV